MPGSIRSRTTRSGCCSRAGDRLRPVDGDQDAVPLAISSRARTASAIASSSSTTSTVCSLIRPSYPRTCARSAGCRCGELVRRRSAFTRPTGGHGEIDRLREVEEHRGQRRTARRTTSRRPRRASSCACPPASARIFSITSTARWPPSNGGSGSRLTSPTNTVTNARRSRTAPVPGGTGLAHGLPDPDDAGRVLRPSLCVREQQREHPPDPRGTEHSC